MQMTGLMDQMYRMVDSGPAALSRVSTFVAQNPNETVTLTISDLAKRIGTGQATIIRFCQNLGFEGYRDFKIAFAQEIERDRATRDRVLPNAMFQTGDTCIADSFGSLHDALVTSAELLDPAQLDRVVQNLRRAGRVDTFGIGVSGICAQIVAQRLVWLGLPAVFHGTPTIALGLARAMSEHSLAIAISHSGITEETVGFLDNAAAAGAMTIAITTRQDTLLSRSAAETILLSAAGPWPDNGSARLVPSVALLVEALARRIG